MKSFCNTRSELTMTPLVPWERSKGNQELLSFLYLKLGLFAFIFTLFSLQELRAGVVHLQEIPLINSSGLSLSTAVWDLLDSQGETMTFTWRKKNTPKKRTNGVWLSTDSRLFYVPQSAAATKEGFFFSCIEATAIVSFMSRKRGVGKYGDRKWVQYL